MPNLKLQDTSYPFPPSSTESWPDITPNVMFELLPNALSYNEVAWDASGTEIFSRYSVSMISVVDDNFEVLDSSFPQDSEVEIDSRLNDDTIFFWDFSPESTEYFTLVFIGNHPAVYLRPTQYDDDPTQGTLIYARLGAPLNTKLLQPSEISGKYYIPSAFLLYADSSINTTTFTIPYDYNEVVVRAVVRPRGAAFTSTGGSGAPNLGANIFALDNPDAIGSDPEGVFFSSGSPGFVIVRHDDFKLVPFSFNINYKYIVTITYKFDAIDFQLEDTSGILVQDTLISPKYKGGFRVPGDPVSPFGVIGPIDVESLMLDGIM